MTGRATCYRCFQPAVCCVCSDIPVVDNQTGVTILQHPRERHHPLGTVRIARLGLRHVQVRVCGPEDAEAMTLAAGLPSGAALLYPSPEARVLSQIPPAERPKHLVVVDGSWSQAWTMVRDVPGLRELPRVRLSPTSPGEYRLRREPRADCLSTIEATVAALRALEPETRGLDELIDAFRQMIDRHIEVRSDVKTGRRRKRPARAGVPRAFTTDYERLVLVYGETQREASQPAVSNAGGEVPPEMVFWCATRPGSGETFARYVRPNRALNREHIVQMGLSPESVRDGVSPAGFERDWAAFLRPGDRVVAWNRHGIKSVVSSGDATLIRGICARLDGESCGHLGDYVHRLGLSPVSNSLPGRAGQQLGLSLAVTQQLRSRGLAALTQ